MRYERENRQLTERERAERARRRAAAARRRRRRMIIKRIRLGCAAYLLLIAIGLISTAGQDNTSSSKGKNTQQAAALQTLQTLKALLTLHPTKMEMMRLLPQRIRKHWPRKSARR